MKDASNVYFVVKKDAPTTLKIITQDKSGSIYTTCVPGLPPQENLKNAAKKHVKRKNYIQMDPSLLKKNLTLISDVATVVTIYMRNPDDLAASSKWWADDEMHLILQV